jgi:ABC-type nitrate/sulfonate/bicarbonate transport system substrate-binding protein
VRSKFVGVVAGLAALVAAGLPAAGQDKPKHKIVITTPGAALHFFPAHLAEAAGLFASEGLEVEWVDVGAGSKQVASVIGGSATMTMLGMQPAITASERGAELVAFAALFNKYPIQVVLNPEVMKRVGLKANMPIDEKVKRLTGLTIGITGVGSSSDSVIRSLLLARGMDPDKVLRIQPMGGPIAMLAALEKKAIDGAMLSAPQAQIAEAGGYGQSAIDPLTGEVPELNGVPYTAMITSRETLARHPELMLKATRSLAKAMLLEETNPEQAQHLLHKKIFPDINAKLFASFEPSYRPAAAKTPVIGREDYARLLQWMKILDPKPITVSYEQMINTDFAKRTAAEILTR